MWNDFALFIRGSMSLFLLTYCVNLCICVHFVCKWPGLHGCVSLLFLWRNTFYLQNSCAWVFECWLVNELCFTGLTLCNIWLFLQGLYKLRHCCEYKCVPWRLSIPLWMQIEDTPQLWPPSDKNPGDKGFLFVCFWANTVIITFKAMMAGFCSHVFKRFHALTSLKRVSGKKSSQQHRADLCGKTLKTFSVTVTEKPFITSEVNNCVCLRWIDIFYQ